MQVTSVVPDKVAVGDCQKRSEKRASEIGELKAKRKINIQLTERKVNFGAKISVKNANRWEIICSFELRTAEKTN